MNISALDTQVGPYSTGWSLPNWSTQQYITSAIAVATGGTYETKAPTVKPEKMKKADLKTETKPELHRERETVKPQSRTVVRKTATAK